MSLLSELLCQPGQIDRLFPFGFVLDGDCRFIEVGSGLKKLCPKLELGDHWSAHLVLHRPATQIKTAEDFRQLTDALVIIRLIRHPLQFRMQVIVSENRVAIIGSPWPHNTQQLDEVGLQLTDFAIWDPVPDLLFLVEGTQRALSKATDLTKQLETQSQSLREAKLEAEKASQAKGLFLATMSHEIRTPVNGVVGLLSLLLQTELSGHQRRLLDACHVSAEALTNVISDVLDFSKLESDQFELAEHEFDLVEMVDRLMTTLAVRMGNDQVRLLHSFDPETPRILWGDSARIRQILINLLDNAIKFTREGHVRLHVAPVKAEDRGVVSRIRFQVDDTGAGISDVDGAHIFDAFSQANSAITRQFGGTGLGLAISNRLAEKMGGSLSFESTVGVGTSFWLDLAGCRGRRGDQAYRPRQMDRRALVVDPYDLQRSILERTLRNHGVEVFSFPNADSAPAALQNLTAGDFAFVHRALANEPGVDRLCHDLTARGATSVLVEPFRVQSESLLAGFDARLFTPVSQSALAELMDGRQPLTSTVASTMNTVRSLSGLRILVAEDNATNRLYIETTLAEHGLVPTMAVDGQEAVNRFTEQPFDLVLMDCRMPVMDGIEATRRIRKLEAENRLQKGIPIVGITADALKTQLEECRRAGMNESMTKPFTPNQLLQCIQNLIDGKSTTTVNEQGDPERTVDSNFILEVCRFKPERIQQFMTSFVEDAQFWIGEIRNSLESGPSHARDAAHALKGSAAMLGAPTIRDIAEIIQHLDDNQLLAAGEQWLANLEEELTEYESSVRDVVEMAGSVRS